MKYLFKNAKIFSGGEIIDGCVVVDGENIAYVGKNPPKGQFDEEIDVCGNVLMSGFVNAHCHTPSTVLRGVSDDLTLEDWLDDIIVKEQSLSDEEVYFSTMLGIAEYVRAGITTIEENYGRITAVVRALKKSGIRARFGIGFADVGKDQGISLDKQLKIVTAAGLKPVCYAHSVYGTTEENFEKLITFAKKNKLPVSTHLSETLTEVGTCSVKNNGLSPPELLETFGFLDRSATVYHAVHCDKDDLELLAAYNVNVVTCSSSNLKLGSGIAPVYAMQCKGINVAIGTDGAYSNNSYDMFKEMFLVATLNKATLNQANILPAKQVLKMAT